MSASLSLQSPGAALSRPLRRWLGGGALALALLGGGYALMAQDEESVTLGNLQAGTSGGRVAMTDEPAATGQTCSARPEALEALDQLESPGRCAKRTTQSPLLPFWYNWQNAYRAALQKARLFP